ncbi:MAG: RnfABCDGE type electron transport complex subunit D [Oligosphaeraceae bacterium]|nr:RnfABCDGE type electron transport complex subunit D [Oligosphaeraceae bacterium]
MTEPEIRLPDAEQLVVSSSPHFHCGNSVAKIMLLVILALLPACLVAVYYFGVAAFRVLTLCMLFCVGTEALCSKLMKRPLEINDFSALLTGLLLGMNLPPGTPSWICLVGSLIAIGIGKMAYGGMGQNPFNPALVGRVALLVSFPQAMNTWQIPGMDSVSGATPLQELGMLQQKALAGDSAELNEFLQNIPYGDYMLGNMGGSLGEACALALILGGIFLIVIRVVRWQIPVFMIATVAVCSTLAWLAKPDLCAPPQFHLLSGGLILGAFFMATDPVTSPMSRLGAILFAIGCGLIVCAIRFWGNYPEGISFAILVMNAMTPLLDKVTMRKPFGTQKKAVKNA